MQLFEWLSRLGAKVLENVTSVDWLAGELPSFLVFTALIGWMVSQFEGWRERSERKPYENWKLVVIGFADPPQALYFEEVRKLLDSEFELFRFVKSVCTTICEIRTKSLAMAQQDWVSIDREKRQFVIDLVRLPDAQIKAWRISGDELTKLRQQRDERAASKTLKSS